MEPVDIHTSAHIYTHEVNLINHTLAERHRHFVSEGIKHYKLVHCIKITNYF